MVMTSHAVALSHQTAWALITVGFCTWMGWRDKATAQLLQSVGLRHT